MSILIDKCAEFIESKNANYLAKEGIIVYYASTTGRKSDFTWHKLTLAEAVRIVRATKLSAEDSKKLRDTHFIAAFQELFRVYEFAVKTRHKVSEGIFNYSEHSKESMGDSIMSLMVNELIKADYTAMYMTEVVQLFQLAQEKVKAGVGAKESRELLFKHFEAAGYEMRTGVSRVFINNKKTPAIMKIGTKPAEITRLSKVLVGQIVNKTCRELT